MTSSLTNQQVLVTGATGFLGHHLIEKLHTMGAKIRVLVRNPNGLDRWQQQGVELFKGDITNRLSLLQATENCSVVFHLAGLIAYKKSERAMMEQINVQGTANVIDACVTHKTPKLLHLSSVVTIGASSTPRALDENSTYNLSAYNLGYFETKRKAEALIEEAHHHNGLNAFMINPSTIYGAGDARKGSRKTQLKVAKGQFRFYPPGGVNVVSIHDVLQGIFLCLDRGQPARRYIICGENLTIQELFREIASAAGQPPPTQALPKFLLSTLGRVGDGLRSLGYETSLSSETAVTSTLYHWFRSDRAQKELGFVPTSARAAIKESVQWMQENGYLDS